MGETLQQKILARASGREYVGPGEILTCDVDLALLLDSGGPRRIWPRLNELGVGVWDPDKIVVMTDHFTPAVDAESAAILKLTREFVREFDIPHFFDMQGIGHVVLAEQGFLQPGMFLCGGDSHSCNGGAYGCFMAGFGAIEMTGVVVTGQIWMQVPETVRVNWSGRFTNGVSAKDIMLVLCRELGMDNAFRVIEFGGDTVEAMPMNERVVLTNMAAELGAETGIIEPDATTLEAIRAAGKKTAADALEWRSDPDADYLETYDFVADTLVPQVAAPHSPDNSGPVENFVGVEIDQAYIGACVGAKLYGPAHGRRDTAWPDGSIGRNTPAGRAGFAEKSWPNRRLRTARSRRFDGRRGLPAADRLRRLCAALGAGILAEDEVCISVDEPQFQGAGWGRMSSDVWLGSPYSVAAAAVAGRIADPREFLAMTTLTGKTWKFSATASTRTSWRRACISRSRWTLAGAALHGGGRSRLRRRGVEPGDIIVAGLQLRHRFRARAGADGAASTSASARFIAAVIRPDLLSQRAELRHPDVGFSTRGRRPARRSAPGGPDRRRGRESERIQTVCGFAATGAPHGDGHRRGIDAIS